MGAPSRPRAERAVGEHPSSRSILCFGLSLVLLSLRVLLVFLHLLLLVLFLVFLTALVAHLVSFGNHDPPERGARAFPASRDIRALLYVTLLRFELPERAPRVFQELHLSQTGAE